MIDFFFLIKKRRFYAIWEDVKITGRFPSFSSYTFYMRNETKRL